MVNITLPQGRKLFLCNEETRAQFICSTGLSVVVCWYKVSFSSLEATCVKMDVKNKGKFGGDQIHEKSNKP